SFEGTKIPSEESRIVPKYGINFTPIITGRLQRRFTRHTISSLLKIPMAFFQTFFIVFKIKPDIIHLHNIHGYYLNYNILFNYLSQLGVPVVWTLHDCWPITGHCAHFESVKCEKWKVACHKCPLKLKYPRSLFLDRSYKNYLLKREVFNSLNNLTVVSVSDWLASKIRHSFLKEKSIQTIYNGIDTEVFNIKDDNILVRGKYKIGNRFMILSVATAWTSMKGLQDLVELSKWLRKDEVIVLIGLTKRQLKTVPKNIIGISRTENRSELASFYSAADLLISASYEESFGMTIAESLACGTPAIVYNRTSSPEIISVDTGFLVEPGDYKSINGIIENFRKSGKAGYSQACRKRALSLFNKEIQYQRYIDLYDSLRLKPS
ncbi:MAG: glycosyl transferase, partial [Flavobacterium sp.]|nr:glycosyl transferase [Flavobacterium sp.]